MSYGLKRAPARNKNFLLSGLSTKLNATRPSILAVTSFCLQTPAALKKIGFDIEVTIRSTMKARYTDVVQHPSRELMVFSYGQGYYVVQTRYV
jgi:hypothetical protein